MLLFANRFSQFADSTAWFQNFAGGDFRPAPGSPLANGGSAMWEPTDDIDGTQRTTPNSIGAYQAD